MPDLYWTMCENEDLSIEQEFVRSQLTNENFTDLVEEGLRQAARSVSRDRREQIAALIANSLRLQDISYVESKHLLRILGELNEIEIITSTKGCKRRLTDRCHQRAHRLRS